MPKTEELKDVRILLVDDSDSQRMLMPREFGRRGAIVTTAVDGVDGLKKLESGKFDVLLTDNDMPNKTGLELLAAIKGQYPHMVRVFASAGLNDTKAIKAAENGAHIAILKPFKMRELVPALADILKQRSAQKDTDWQGKVQDSGRDGGIGPVL